jgi:hypothetical protein
MFQVLISDLLNFLVVVAGGPADTGPDTQPRAQDPDQGEGKPQQTYRDPADLSWVIPPAPRFFRIIFLPHLYLIIFHLYLII